MAEVYKVWDSQRMSFLAMKVLHEDLALDKVFVRRFAREAQNLERLQHPNIVRFYGFEKQNRLAFMLMEYIEGETLKHLIHDTQKAMPLDQLYAIMQGVFGALHYAHQNGVVHCDIKPANIMVDRSGNVQLADFGIARLSDAATTTMVGTGTPAYMAPEQIRGENPAPHTDIYALGIVLYEMLTGGERPFTGEKAEVTGGTGEKVRWEHLNLSPPSPRQWNHAISPEMERIVLKALAKDPAERYADILAFRNDLGRALDGKVSEDKGKQELQERIAKNLAVSAALGEQVPTRKEQDVPQKTVSGKNNNLLIVIFLGVFLLMTILFFTARSTQNVNVTPTIDHPPPTTSKLVPEETATLFTEVDPTQGIPPTDVPSKTPQPSETVVPTSTFTSSPTSKPSLSVDFVDTKYVYDYAAKHPVLGELAQESYSWDQRSQSNITLPFTIGMRSSQIVVWRWYWCATTQSLLDSNMANFTPEFSINGDMVSLSSFVEMSFSLNGLRCSGLQAALENWTPGQYELVQRISYDKEIYDGEKTYEAGARTYIYSITVR